MLGFLFGFLQVSIDELIDIAKKNLLPGSQNVKRREDAEEFGRIEGVA